MFAVGTSNEAAPAALHSDFHPFLDNCCAGSQLEGGVFARCWDLVLGGSKSALEASPLQGVTGVQIPDTQPIAWLWPVWTGVSQESPGVVRLLWVPREGAGQLVRELSIPDLVMEGEPEES